jgi:hypothetical protein
MQPHPENNSNGARKRRNARLLESALGDGVTWVELPAKRKVGVIMAMLGIIALPISLVQGWIWALSGILAIAVGWALTYSGVKLKDNSPWPPYGPG